MTLLAILSDGFFAAVAAVGFGAVSDPPMRAFPAIALLAAVGHALRFCLMDTGVDIASASLCASVAIFTIGLMLSFSKRINLFVVLFLCHWSLIGFSKVYFFGIPEDLLLASALVPALYLFFKEYIDVNFRRNAKPDLRVMNMLLLAMCSGLGVFFAATIWQQLVGMAG